MNTSYVKNFSLFVRDRGIFCDLTYSSCFKTHNLQHLSCKVQNDEHMHLVKCLS